MSCIIEVKCDVDMLDEFQHVLNWAVANKLTINMCKNKKNLYFTDQIAINYLAPSELPGIERVLCAKLLDVWLQNDFSMRKHVDYIMHICNQRSYLLTQLKRQDLPMTQLQSVFDAIVLSRVLYAVSAWRGYLSAGEMASLQQLFARAKRLKYCSEQLRY